MGQNQSNYSWHKDDNVYKNGNGGFRGNGYQAFEEDPMMLEATRARNLFIPSGVKLAAEIGFQMHQNFPRSLMVLSDIVHLRPTVPGKTYIHTNLESHLCFVQLW